MRKLWRVHFPAGADVLQMDLAAPSSADRADVIVTATMVFGEAGIMVDAFEAEAVLLGEYGS